MPLQTHERLELPEAMRGRLESFRRRVWMVKLVEAVLAACFGLALSYLLVFLLDRLWDTPSWLRSLILIAGTAGFTVWLPLKWHRWVWRTRRLEQVARLLRFRWPRLSDQLLGIVELVHAEAEQERSSVLCRAAMRQVDEQSHQYDFQSAVPDPRHRRWAWRAGLTVAIVLAILAVVPAAGTNALQRWLMPWKDTPRYTFAQIEDLPDRLVVPFAESFPLQARLAKDSVWSPQRATAQYADQQRLQAKLQKNSYEFEIPPQKRTGILQVAVGDARQQLQVQPTTRPELTEVSVRASLPQYLQYSRDERRDARGGAVSLLKGSEAVIEGTATRALAELRMNSRAQPVRGKRVRSESVPIHGPMSLELTWRDHLGLSAREPFQLSIVGLDDEPPTIACSQPNNQQVLLENEVLTFQIAAEDDYGIQHVGIAWKGLADPLRNPHPTAGEQLVLAGAPEEKRVQTETAFSPKRLGIPPQSLEVRFFTVDYLPRRERVYSQPYVLHVLTPEEHAIWLTAQLRKWFGGAQAVYEREQQLHETNKELRALSPEALDQPENRRRIEQQASAEHANARRLQQVTSAGETLLKEAARNDQFNVATMESLAAMLQSLEEISQQRMPSVADLLKQAAVAKGAPNAAGAPEPSEQESPSEEVGESAPRVGVNRDGRGAPGAGQPATPQTTPSISDVESGFNELKPPDPSQPQQAAPGKLTLPGTTVLGGGPPQEGEAPPASPAQETLDEAVQQQRDLLAEFARVAEELQKILDDLEGSTFVKRLKAASRRQLDVAADLNEELLGGFGLSSSEVEDQKRELAEQIAEREAAHSEFVYLIQQDLDAYFNRVLEGKFQTVLNEMKTTEVAHKIHTIGSTAEANWSGRAIVQAEHWADALDRWAEQLVGPG